MKSKHNQKGVLTIDFIFSFTMIIGLFQLFYVLSYTFMVAHLTQYITFASSRVYFAGQIDPQSQETLARQKFESLTENTAVANFFKSAFKLSDFEAREFTEINAPETWRQKYTGVRVTFESKVLDFNVPFLGRTSSELEGRGFTANIGSYLYREPTATECFTFMQDRARAILELDSRFSQAQGNGFNPNDISVSADNGC
jgi:hypothetical protein